jgi:hypothetical protein
MNKTFRRCLLLVLPLATIAVENGPAGNDA